MSRRLGRTFAFLLGSLLLTAFFGSPLAAQSSEERSVLDGVYSAEQAEKGEATYGSECALCHTTQEFTGRLFQLSWSNRSVHDLFRSIRNTMPFDRPGGLTDEQYSAIVSYLLKLNNYPTGDEALGTSEDDLANIRIEAPPSR
jgi:S-disulfanyl-L-cysteine oxidoreductase SoxD